MISDHDLLKEWERFSLEEMKLLVENALRSTYYSPTEANFEEYEIRKRVLNLKEQTHG